MTTENLEDLTAQAAALDAEPVAAGAAAQADAAPAPDVAAEVAALLKTAAGLLTPAFPSLAAIYTDETCRQLATAAAPVMDKYNVSVGGLFDRWGLEITLAAVALPVGLSTWNGVKADLAARKLPPPAPAAQTPAHVGQAPAPAAPVIAGTLVIPAPGAAS